jgi:hypothetical protein
MLDVSGAGTAGALTLCRVNKCMRESILNNAEWQKRILARMITVRGARLCCPEVHSRKWSFEYTLEAVESILKNDNLTGGDWDRVLRIINNLDISYALTALQMVKDNVKGLSYVQLAAVIAEHPDPSAMNIALQLLDENPDSEKPPDFFRIIVTQANRPEENAIERAREILDTKASDHPHKLYLIVQIAIASALKEWKKSKSDGVKGTSLFEHTKAIAGLYRRIDRYKTTGNGLNEFGRMYIEMARLQLNDDTPDAVEEALKILQLNAEISLEMSLHLLIRNNCALFLRLRARKDLSEITDELVRSCNVLAIFDRCEREIDRINKNDLSFVDMHKDDLKYLFDYAMTHKHYLFAWNVLRKYPNEYGMRLLVKQIASSPNPGAVQCALALAHDDPELLFNLAALCKSKDIPSGPVETRIDAMIKLAYTPCIDLNTLTENQTKTIESYL